MAETVFKENPNNESKERFFEISDSLDNEMCVYYSNYIMYLKTEENQLFGMYLALKKENVKKNLLSQLISEWKKESESKPSIQEQKFNRNNQ